MNIPKRLVAFFIVFIPFLSLAQGQESSSKKRIFFEKVYLHTDRELYFAGEDIWYRAYLLNAQVNQLLNTSNNLYVELLAPDASIVERKVIRLEEGLGAGDFRLSDSIAKGIYRIRAYTNWMKNFGDNFIFEKKIQVSNDIKAPAGTKASSRNTKAETGTVPGKVLRFFPEGGSMLQNTSGIIAFKAEDESGKPLRVKGAILTARGDTVTNFESRESGVGAMIIMPLAGEKYSAKGVFNNEIPFTVPLPEVQEKGFSIRVINTDTAAFKVLISTNEASLNEYKGRALELRARHGGVAYAALKFEMTELQKMLEIPKSDFPAGITAVTLSDDQNRPYCERLLYIEPRKKVKVELKTNKTVYAPKERVVVNIKTSDSENKPVRSELSMAVVDGNIVPPSEGNILSYIMLQSEVRGKIENPGQYFDLSNAGRARQLDLLLMTQGWRDFVWKRMRDTSITITNINETGFTISGKVTDKRSDKPLAGINVTLFANGAKGSKLFGTTTNAAGKYFFDNVNLEGNQSVKLVSTDNEAKKTGKIILDSIFTKPLSVAKLPFMEAEEAAAAVFAKEAASRKQRLRIFSLSDTIELKEVAIKRDKQVSIFGDVLTTFGYPDQNFTITAKDHDYASLSHYLLTNVNGAMPSDNAETNAVVFMADGKKVAPRIIVDKREDLFERLDYYSLPMSQIEKITVRHMMGSMDRDSSGMMFANGKSNHVYLIYLSLKPGAFDRKELSLLNANVKGYYQEKTFYSPAYPAGAVKTKTDLRTTLYWHPKIKTDETGSATLYFYNADPKSKVWIAVEGVTTEGQPVVGSSVYEVK